MAAVPKQQLAIDERQVRVVTKPSHNDQITRPCGEAIVAGDPIRADGTTGRWVKALADTAPHGLMTHVAWRTAAVGDSCTGLRACSLDFLDLTGLAFGTKVYLSDTGTYDTTAGTVTVQVGEVVPVFATLLGVAPDKILDVVNFGH